MKILIVFLAVCLFFMLAAAFLIRAEKQATVRRTLPFERTIVWKKAFAVERQAEWRSDIRAVTVTQKAEPRVWRELLNTGGEITLCDKSMDLHDSWTIESVQNAHFLTRWTGEFKEIGKAETEIIFTEQFRARNIWGKILLFLFINPEKMMQTYADDLQRELTKQRN